jgi:hypothetical protein
MILARRLPHLAALVALAACNSTTVTVPPDAPVADASPDAPAADAPAERFSFFVTSLRALQALSGRETGFGGDLRYGETGPGAGLRGADRICAAIAERSMPGAGRKPWRAFLSATDGGDGRQVNAIDRVGTGPWYDRLGRLLANNRTELLNVRPPNAHPVIINDFPNEDGVPNHRPDPTMGQVDNHDMLTGSNERGELYARTATCLDWTSARGDVASEGRPRVGHSWPRTGTPVGPMGMGDGGVPPFMGDGGFRPMMGDGGFRPMMGDGGFLPPPFDGGMPDSFTPCAGMTSGATCTLDVLGMRLMGTCAPTPDGRLACMPTGGPGEVPPGGMTSGDHWISALDEAGCAPGVSLIEMGPPDPSMPTVGSGGGYGGFYCFSLTP